MKWYHVINFCKNVRNKAVKKNMQIINKKALYNFQFRIDKVIKNFKILYQERLNHNNEDEGPSHFWKDTF